MISSGQITLGGVAFDLARLDEAEYLARSAPLGSTQTFQHGDRSIHRVERISVFGRDCTVGFEFKAGQLETVTLYLVDALGEGARERHWELAGLEEEAQVHAEWLGQLLGGEAPVRDHKFDWGRVWVTFDPKGWNTGITLAPRR